MSTRDPYEDLAMIRRLMEESREIACGHGKHLVAWGILMAGALVATYVALATAASLPLGWIWGIAIAAGWAYSLRAGTRDARRAPVRTVAGRLLGSIWLGFGITGTVFAVLGLYTPAIPAEALGGTMAALLGFAFFASGAVAGSAWLRYLAAGWWAGSVVMFLWPGAHTLPLMAAMIVLLQVIPGVVIQGRAGRKPAGQEA